MHHDLLISKSIDSFDSKERITALEDSVGLLKASKTVNINGVVNMHIHSFYSFNSMGFSPAHIALTCRHYGLYAVALCDFDVLDGLEEFLAAGQMLGLRVAVHLETRVFVREYAEAEINSPGEPGVTYIMGAGFGCLPARDSAAIKTLNAFRQHANLRNSALVGRINERLPDISIDYDADVMPLSPGGCPTERHIVQSYRKKAQVVFPKRDQLVAYWSKLLRKTNQEVTAILADPPAMNDNIRSLLAKSGGIGYVRPNDKTFLPVDDFIAWVLECEAVPMVTWLDGTSAGEGDMLKMLECMQAKGAAALNIIPDRNHNIKSANERCVKIQKLNDVILAARKLHFPVNIGTEMNKNGQPFVDDLGCEALSLYQDDFLRGANIMVGQTTLTRYAGFSYCGKAASDEYGGDTSRKNDFFESVGKLPPLSIKESTRLTQMTKESAFKFISDSTSKGKWCL